MDIPTLQKVIKICEKAISERVITAFSFGEDIADEIKNELKVYAFSIQVIEEILENLKGDEDFYE